MNTCIGTYFQVSGPRSVAGRKTQINKRGKSAETLVTSTLELASCFQQPVLKSAELSKLRKLIRCYGQGEGIFNDILLGASEILKKSLGSLSDMAKPLQSFALKSGVAVLGPIGLGAAAGLLAADGPKEFLEGCKERNVVKGLEGARSSLLACEALAMAGQLAFSISPGMLTKVAGIVGKAIAPPLTVGQILVDSAQGVAKIAKSRETHDKRLFIDGLTDMGMATALTLGLALGPAVSVPLAGAVLVGKILNDRLAKREQAVDPGYVHTKILQENTTSKHFIYRVGPPSASRGTE